MRKTLAIIGIVAALIWAGAAIYYSDAGAQDPPFPGATQIARESSVTPTGSVTTTTYGNADDTARVAVRVTSNITDDIIYCGSPEHKAETSEWGPSMTGVACQQQPSAPVYTAWGRLTTHDSVDNIALGIVPAWKPPAGFDHSKFKVEAGCDDARAVTTETPRADVDTGELGYTANWLLPAADHPISGTIALCLSGDTIIQVTSLWLTEGEAIAPTADLVAAVVAGLPAETVPAAEPACTPIPGEFVIQIIVEECA